MSESFYDQATGLIGVYDGPCRVTLFNTNGEQVDQVEIPCRITIDYTPHDTPEEPDED